MVRVDFGTNLQWYELTIMIASQESEVHVVVAHRSSRCPYALLLIELRTPVIAVTRVIAVVQSSEFL